MWRGAGARGAEAAATPRAQRSRGCAGGAALRAARVPGLGPAPCRPMRARGRRGCPHTLPAAPLRVADPLTPHPALRQRAPVPELGAPAAASGRRSLRPSPGRCAPVPGVQVSLRLQPSASLWPPRGVSRDSLSTPSRCRVHAPPGRAAGVPGELC